MKKQLLIIVYKINIAGLSKVQAEQIILNLMEHNSLTKDEEIKEDYIVREIWFPITEGQSDVKIIYPQPNSVKSIELEELISEISLRISESPEGAFTRVWERLVRELKLQKLEKIEC